MPEALTDAYVGLIDKLFPLIGEKGLSAAVYTQTTDVEIEVNGLMTYDREVVKMDLDKVRDANHGKLPGAGEGLGALRPASSKRTLNPLQICLKPTINGREARRRLSSCA